MQAGQFVDWVANNEVALQQQAESTTRYGKLISLEPYIDGEIVFLLCRYTTGDASGQNMVTIATEALCRYIETRLLPFVHARKTIDDVFVSRPPDARRRFHDERWPLSSSSDSSMA